MRSKRLATINGEVVTEDDVNKAAASELENLELRRMQFEAGYKQDKHEIIETKLRAILEEKLLDAEAKKRGIARPELIAAEIDSKVTPPAEEAVTAFFEQNKNRIQFGPDPMPQIRQYLTQQKRNQVRTAFIATLSAAHNVNTYLEPLRVDVASDGFPALGPASAPVTIIEFSDFECPFCAQLFPTMKEVEKKYAGKVRRVFRQFPLHTIHPNAQKAAEASLCAADQGRFWELHDAMFGNPRNLGVETLKAKAAELKLNAAAFNECLDSGKHAARVKQDVTDGTRAGVTGTPAIFINGRFLSGAQPLSTVSAIIDDELARAGK
jgi:protein-disulfide isomerase